MPKTYSPCSKCRKLNRVTITSPSEAKRIPVCGNCKAELPIHGAINELSASGLQTIIEKSPLPVVVDFWAPWCGPCRVFAPTFEQASMEFAEKAVFVKVNTELHPLASSSHGIRGIPTLILFDRGLEVQRQSGAMSYPMFQQWLRPSLHQGHGAAAG